MHTDTIERRDGWAMRLADEAERREDRLNRAEADLSYEFQRSVELGDPDATPDWTGTVPDWKKAQALGLPAAQQNTFRRRRSVAEVLSDSLDYPNGPDMGDVVTVLSYALRSTDPMVAMAAKQLVHRCGAKFAQMNVEDEA